MLDPARWTALVARRPELEIKDDEGYSLVYRYDEWQMGMIGVYYVVPTQQAEALIFRKLVEALPKGFGLFKSHTGERFICVFCEHLKYTTIGEYRPDPLDALLTFHEQH